MPMRTMLRVLARFQHTAQSEQPARVKARPCQALEQQAAQQVSGWQQKCLAAGVQAAAAGRHVHFAQCWNSAEEPVAVALLVRWILLQQPQQPEVRQCLPLLLPLLQAIRAVCGVGIVTQLRH